MTAGGNSGLYAACAWYSCSGTLQCRVGAGFKPAPTENGARDRSACQGIRDRRRFGIQIVA